jgi:hypothetical protein
MAAAWAAVGAIQPATVASQGRYAQIGRSHSTLPRDGNATAADLKAVKVGDRGQNAATWAALNVNSSACSLTVDEYEGPNGKGYSLTGRVQIGNSPVQKWRKTLHTGPEAWRAHDWQQESAVTL